jgi:hypothetical protein
LDGGETWSAEEHPEFDVTRKPEPLTHAMDFGHPDFALRCRRKCFWYSYDRGRTWDGPHDFGDFGLGLKLTARTDYVIKSPTEALLFLSAEVDGVQAGNYKDRAFCARTADGGRTFHFVSWINDDPRIVRGAMPATVCLPSNALVTTLRRRVDLTTKTRAEHCWIDAYQSLDQGASWQFLARVAYTDLGGRNGNPSSLTRLADGRLCVFYGFRAAPLGMRAKVSADNGATWGPEIVLRDDAATWDFGYPRSVLRPDGKVVSVYYYTTRQRPEQHIAATNWSAGSIAR